jgi:H+-translocating NAD(P) transhydrogenase subunit alpha
MLVPATVILVTSLTIFVLALFVGVEIINKVPQTLHTPLMSGSNAISGITVLGAVMCGTKEYPTLSLVLGFIAVVFAMINVMGGFLVTHRMLGKFKQKD